MAKNNFTILKEKVVIKYTKEFMAAKSHIEKTFKEKMEKESTKEAHHRLQKAMEADITSKKNEVQIAREAEVEQLKEAFEKTKREVKEKLSRQVNVFLKRMVHYSKATR